MEASTQAGLDPEIVAIGVVYDALKDLDPSARARVLNYVAKKLGAASALNEEEPLRGREDQAQAPSLPPPAAGPEQDDAEGVSPVALKWMRRSGLTSTGLSLLFSLGVDEIDLVANKVPGENRKDRMRSVLLRRGWRRTWARGWRV